MFQREWTAAPRRPRLYLARALYPVGLLLLIGTSWVLVFGNQVVHNPGDIALFGLLLFQFLATVQMSLAILFSPLLAAGAVAQEKDRGTLSLLLLTRLHDGELVVGQLAASLLTMANLLAAGAPVFLCAALFGGVAFEQIARAYAVTVCATLAAGSLGTVLAFWREKTFQTLALAVLVLVAWIGFWEAAAAGAFGREWGGVSTALWASWASPFRALQAAVSGGLDMSLPSGLLVHPADRFCVGALTLSAVMLGIAVARVRTWNTSGARRDETALADRESIFGAPQVTDANSANGQPAPVKLRPYRSAWDQPILWREVATWAYGKKIIFVRVAYLLLAAVAAAGLWQIGVVSEALTPVDAAYLTVPIMLVSLMLINALAVNAFCNERDGRTLDLLLATDLTPKEIVFGKLAGILWNAKEMILVPLLLTLLVWTIRDQHGYPVLDDEKFWYTIIGLIVMDLFAAVLGIHVGMHYANSRAAMAVSLGTVIFLFIGVSSCMRMIVAFGGSFQMQFLPFAAMIFGGGVGMFVALGLRNPSPALAWTSFLCPVATFYAIVSFILNKPHFVFIVTTLTYGFATASMLIPAISEFDVATGRTTGPED